jgi:hypothetical protein
MKTTIKSLIVLLLLATSGVILNVTNHDSTKKRVNLLITSTKNLELSNNEVARSVETTVKNIKTSDIPTHNEFETEFDKLSDKEIKNEIEKNNLLAQENNYFENANKWELNRELTGALAKYIRLNSTLLKNLLDRQLKELETELL